MTDIAQMGDFSEQRMKMRGPLFNFELKYRRLPFTDVQSIQTWQATIKGMFDKTVSITLESTTWSNLTLMEDVHVFREDSPGLYSVEFILRQTQNRSYPVPSVGSSFPTLPIGIVTQLPWGSGIKYSTSYNDNPTGQRYPLAWLGGGFSGLPSVGLRSWQLNFPVISEAELAILENYFVGQSGMWGSFSFTDPNTATVYSHCRFGSDTMSIVYQSPGIVSTQLVIEQTNNS